MKITETYKKNLEVLEEKLEKLPFSNESQERILKYAKDPTLFLNSKSVELLKRHDAIAEDYRIEIPISKLMVKNIPEVPAVYNLLMEILYAENDVADILDLDYSCIYKNKMNYKKNTRKVWRFLTSKADLLASNYYESVVEKALKTSECLGVELNIFSVSLLDILEFGFGNVCRNLKDFADKSDRDTLLVSQIKQFFIDESNYQFTFLADEEEKNKDEIDRLKDSIKTIILKTSEVISSKIVSEKINSRAYVSFNCFDWLMCSTGENWTSCLSLESRHCFGTGLLGLTACPDASMIFIEDTNKPNKENAGFVAPNMKNRAWMFYTDTNKYALIKWYPNNISSSINLDALKRMGFDTILIRNEGGDEYDMGVNTYSAWKPITFKNNQIAWIYTDYYNINSNEDKIYLTFGDYQMMPDFELTEDGLDSVSNSVEDRLNSKGYTISEMLEAYIPVFTDEELETDSNYVRCDDCGRLVCTDTEDVIYLETGEAICSNCSDSYFYCDDCEEYHSESDCTYLEKYGRYVCDDCLDSRYTLCDITGEYIENYDIVSLESNTTSTVYNVCDEAFRDLACAYKAHLEDIAEDGEEIDDIFELDEGEILDYYLNTKTAINIGA